MPEVYLNNNYGSRFGFGMVDAKFFPILEKNLFNSSAMALSFLISCPLIINLLGEFKPLDLRHMSCLILFQISFVLPLLIINYSL